MKSLSAVLLIITGIALVWSLVWLMAYYFPMASLIIFGVVVVICMLLYIINNFSLFIKIVIYLSIDIGIFIFFMYCTDMYNNYITKVNNRVITISNPLFTTTWKTTNKNKDSVVDSICKNWVITSNKGFVEFNACKSAFIESK